MKTNSCFKLTTIALVLVVLLQYSDGISSVNAQETRAVSGFSEISCSISGHIYISQSENESLRLEGPSTELQKIITEVQGGKLKIYSTKNISGKDDISMYISVKELTDLSLSGSCKVDFQTPIKVDVLRMALSGSGTIDLPKLSGNKLEAHISGSGNVNLGGNLENSFVIHISGSGDIKASTLEAKKVEVHISGSGSAEVFPTEKLESRVSGSGSVYYKGRPLVDAAASGSGKTKPL